MARERSATVSNISASLNGLGGVNVSDTTTETCIRSLVVVEPRGIGVEHLAQIGLDFSPSGNRRGGSFSFDEGIDDRRAVFV
jgi:hypothetical protein